MRLVSCKVHRILPSRCIAGAMSNQLRSHDLILWHNTYNHAVTYIVPLTQTGNAHRKGSPVKTAPIHTWQWRFECYAIGPPWPEGSISGRVIVPPSVNSRFLLQSLNPTSIAGERKSGTCYAPICPSHFGLASCVIRCSLQGLQSFLTPYTIESLTLLFSPTLFLSCC